MNYYKTLKDYLNLEIIEKKIKDFSDEKYHKKYLNLFTMILNNDTYAILIQNNYQYRVYEDNIQYNNENNANDLLAILNSDIVEIIPVNLFYQISEFDISLNTIFDKFYRIPISLYKTMNEYSIKLSDYLNINDVIKIEQDGGSCLEPDDRFNITMLQNVKLNTEYDAVTFNTNVSNVLNSDHEYWSNVTYNIQHRTQSNMMIRKCFNNSNGYKCKSYKFIRIFINDGCGFYV